MNTLTALTSLGPDHLDEVERLFAQTWWTQTRTRDDIAALLAGSTATVGLLDPSSGRLQAFARALSDGVYKAFVMDVIVAESLRGHGTVGAELMHLLLAQPAVAAVADVELYCHPGRARFYRSLGFETAIVGGGDGVGATQLLLRRSRTH